MKELDSLEPEVPAEEIAAADEQPAENTPKAEAETPKEPPKAEPEEKKQTMVPHAAMHEERERRKATERELQTLRQQQAVIQDRYQQLWQAVNQKQPEIPPEDVDPLKNYSARIAQAEKTQQQIAQELAARRQQDEQAARIQQFTQHVTGLEQVFVKEQPDYHDALKYARERRAEELEALGYPPEVIPQVIQQNAMEVAWQAVQQGRNPAQAIYNAAKVMGYKPKGTEQAQKLETMQRGLEASKTLGNGGGGSGMPTPEQIADMSEDEFAAFKKKLGGKQLSDVL